MHWHYVGFYYCIVNLCCRSTKTSMQANVTSVRFVISLIQQATPFLFICGHIAGINPSNVLNVTLGLQVVGIDCVMKDSIKVSLLCAWYLHNFLNDMTRIKDISNNKEIFCIWSIFGLSFLISKLHRKNGYQKIRKVKVSQTNNKK